MKKNIDKIRTEMIAAGISPEKIAIYLESLESSATLVVEQTVAVRPTAATNDPWVIGPDGVVVRRSDLLGRDTDSWDCRK